MNYRNRVMDDPQSIVDYYAEYFQSVFVSASSFEFFKCMSTKTASKISPPNLSEDDDFKALKKIKNKSTTDPNAIPSF